MPDEIRHFSEQVIQAQNAIKSSDRVSGIPGNVKRNAVSKAIHLILLLNHIQPARGEGYLDDEGRFAEGGSNKYDAVSLNPVSAIGQNGNNTHQWMSINKVYDVCINFGLEGLEQPVLLDELTESITIQGGEEISVTSSADEVESNLLLPVITATTVPLLTTYMQALKSKTMLAGLSTLVVGGVMVSGKMLWSAIFSGNTGDWQPVKSNDAVSDKGDSDAVNQSRTILDNKNSLIGQGGLYEHLGIYLGKNKNKDDGFLFLGVKSSVAMMWEIYKSGKSFRDLISEAEQCIVKNAEAHIAENEAGFTRVRNYYQEHINQPGNPVGGKELHLRELQALNSTLQRIDEFYRAKNQTTSMSDELGNAKNYANLIFNIRSKWVDFAYGLNYSELASQSDKSEEQKLEYAKKVVNAYQSSMSNNDYSALLIAITFNSLMSGVVERNEWIKADPIQAIKSFSGRWNEILSPGVNYTQGGGDLSYLDFKGSEHFTSQTEYMDQFVNYKQGGSIKDAEIYAGMIEPASETAIIKSYVFRAAYQPDTGWLALPHPNAPPYIEIPGRVGFIEYADGIWQVVSFLDGELKIFNYSSNEVVRNPLLQEIKNLPGKSAGFAVGGRDDDRMISWRTNKNLTGAPVYHYFFDKVWGSIVESPVAVRNYAKVALTYNPRNSVSSKNGCGFNETVTGIIRQGLDSYAEVAKDLMWKKSGQQQVAEQLLPLYKEIYRTWTDKEHQFDWAGLTEEVLLLVIQLLPYGIKLLKIPAKATQQITQTIQHYRMQEFRGSALMKKSSPRIRAILAEYGKKAGNTLSRLGYDLIDPLPVDIISHANPSKLDGVKGHPDFNNGNVGKNGNNGELSGGALSVIHAPSPLSTDLAKRLKPDLRVSELDTKQLQRKDRGYYEDFQGNMYLHTGGSHYVRLKSALGAGSNRFRIVDRDGRTRLLLRYVDNQFRIESLGERLQVIQHTGLSGRAQGSIAGSASAVDRIAMRGGESMQSAQTLLARYELSNSGVFSDVQFANHFFKTGAPPGWAKNFEARHIPVTSPPLKTVSDVTRISLTEGAVLASKISELKFGAEVGSGQFSTVSLDASDDRFVIKPVPVSGNNLGTNTGKAAYLRTGLHEARSFERYYGEGSVALYQAASGELYIRQQRIPGGPLKSISGKVLPHDAEARYTAMEQELAVRGIMHNDLNSGNVLWDADSQSFYPIDIDDYTDNYQKQEKVSKGEGANVRQRTPEAIAKAKNGKMADDSRMQELRKTNIRLIREHIPPVPTLHRGVGNTMSLEGLWVLNNEQRMLKINPEEILTGKTVVFTVKSAGGDKLSVSYPCESNGKKWSTYRWIQDVAERVNNDQLNFVLGKRTENTVQPKASMYENGIWVPVGRDGKAMYSITWKIEPLSASKIPDRYKLPQEGIFSDIEFAGYFAKHGTVPNWARYFDITHTPVTTQSVKTVSGTMPLLLTDDVHFSPATVDLKLGEPVGRGTSGHTVSIDATDNRFVIKPTGDEVIPTGYSRTLYLKRELHKARATERYYGVGSTQVYQEQTGRIYIRQLRIEGTPLNKITGAVFPRDAVARYMHMEQELAARGIIHDDLNSGNVLWDAGSQSFYPIDIDDYTNRKQQLEQIRDDKAPPPRGSTKEEAVSELEQNKVNMERLHEINIKIITNHLEDFVE